MPLANLNPSVAGSETLSKCYFPSRNITEVIKMCHYKNSRKVETPEHSLVLVLKEHTASKDVSLLVLSLAHKVT